MGYHAGGAVGERVLWRLLEGARMGWGEAGDPKYERVRYHQVELLI
jgi:hypothetical protein